MNKEKVIAEIRHHPFVLGGKAHSGWLPDNAAIPKPTPRKEIFLNLEIVDEGNGFGLYFWSDDKEYRGDYWSETIQGAKEQALFSFKIEEDAWQEPTQTD